MQALYTEEELCRLFEVPEHIAIIMDGNRRWGESRGASFLGHQKGVETLDLVVKACIELKVKILTVFAFSTENWKRSRAEVNFLWKLFQSFLEQKRELLIEKGIALKSIGDLSRLPIGAKKTLSKTIEATSGGKSLDLVLALNYGARDEIRRAFEKLFLEGGKITEERIAKALDMEKEPDLLIRTSGEMRLSNFLLYQLSYTELYFTKVLWPDFSHKDLYRAVLEFQKRKRRRGT